MDNPDKWWTSPTIGRWLNVATALVEVKSSPVIPFHQYSAKQDNPGHVGYVINAMATGYNPIHVDISDKCENNSLALGISAGHYLASKD